MKDMKDMNVGLHSFSSSFHDGPLVSLVYSRQVRVFKLHSLTIQSFIHSEVVDAITMMDYSLLKEQIMWKELFTEYDRSIELCLYKL